MIPLAFWEGLAVGIVVAIGGTLVLWRYLLRRGQSGPRPGPTVVADPQELSWPPAHSGGPEATGLVPVQAAAVSPTVALAPPVPGPPRGLLRSPPSVSHPSASPNGGTVRISQRVLFHIASFGRIAPSDVAPWGLCQGGMVDALEVNQGALTGVLRRRVAGGVLQVNREHVRGANRRVKVYRLTFSGEQLVRELRGRAPPK